MLDKKQALLASTIYLSLGFVLYSFLKKPATLREPFTRAFKTKTTVAGVRG